MKIETSPIVVICTGLSVVCAGITGAAQVSQNLQSTRLESERMKGLRVLTQHTLSDSCWKVASTSLKIGEKLTWDGKGKPPTSCFISENGQFGFAGYLNGKLQILYVFSQKEVNAKRSQILKEQAQ